MDGKPVTEKFNRKTFDPFGNPAHGRTLGALRSCGRFRRHTPSTAYLDGIAAYYGHRKGGSFLDIGCGDSTDYKFAKKDGFKITRVDLFEPWTFLDDNTSQCEGFWQSDVVEHIPVPDNSIDFAVSQAMYDLIEPEARDQFHREVFRVMKPGGVFSLYYFKLAAGWGWDTFTEHQRVLNLWQPYKLLNTRFIAIKPK